MAVVLLLAAVLAANVIRNSDLWLHLTSGKAIAYGERTDDPFSRADDHQTVNHSWLFDLLLYGSWLADGNTGVLLLRSLLVIGLAAALVGAGSAGRTSVLACSTATLALIALAPWLSLKPQTASLFLFAVTLLLLERARRHPGSELRSVLAISLVLVLWANVDRWYLLGVGTVALYCASGLFLQRRRKPDQTLPSAPFGAWTQSPRSLLLTLVAGALAGVVSPYGLDNLALPPELLPETAKPLQADPALSKQFLTPFASVYGLANLFVHPVGPGIAYWMLFLFGLASFGATFSEIRWERLLLWVALFALSRHLNLTVPFFAVAAGPLLALNAGAWLRKRPQGLLLRRAALIGLIVLLPIAWIGLMQPGSLGARTWSVENDPSLQKAAQYVLRWRLESKLDAKSNGLNLSPEAGNYFAWWCPQEKGFVTSRSMFSPELVRDYVAVRQGLTDRASKDPNWRGVLRRWKVDHIVLSSSDPLVMLRAMRKMLPQEEWPLLYAGGSVIIVGWRDPAQKSYRVPDTKRFKGLDIVDLNRLAFAKHVDNVPETPPPKQATAPSWWDVFSKQPSRRTFDQEQAQCYLQLFESFRPVEDKKNVSLIASSQVAAGAFLTAPGMAFLALPEFSETLDDGPAAALYVAVQAARRSLHDDPHDPQSYFLLGESYYRMSRHTRERSWKRAFGALGRLRDVQAIAAYTQALRLQPDMLHAHFRLAEIYHDLQYKDTALEHYQAILRVLSRQPTDPGQIEYVRDQTDAGAREVEELEKKYEVNALHMKPADRCFLAARLGLTSRALKLLMDFDIAALGPEGLELELTLLLNLGRSAQARDWMTAEHDALLGNFKTRWINVLADAAAGDYDAVRKHLRDRDAPETAPNGKPVTVAQAVPLLLGHALLSQRPETNAVMTPAFHSLVRRFDPYGDARMIPARLYLMAGKLNVRASGEVLQGLLALESGRPALACASFQHALSFWDSYTGQPFAAISIESRVGRDIANYYQQILTGSR